MRTTQEAINHCLKRKWLSLDEQDLKDIKDALFMLTIGEEPTPKFKIRIEELERLFGNQKQDKGECRKKKK